MKNYIIREKKSNSLSKHLLQYRDNIKEDINKEFKDIEWSNKLTNEDYLLERLKELSISKEPMAFMTDSLESSIIER